MIHELQKQDLKRREEELAKREFDLLQREISMITSNTNKDQVCLFVDLFVLQSIYIYIYI